MATKHFVESMNRFFVLHACVTEFTSMFYNFQINDELQKSQVIDCKVAHLSESLPSGDSLVLTDAISSQTTTLQSILKVTEVFFRLY